MGIELIKGDEDKNTDTCIWFVRFYGTDDCKEMEQLLMEKEDWPGINLACGDPSADPPIKPWVSREKVIPDGRKSKDAIDYTQLQVRAYTLVWVPHPLLLVTQDLTPVIVYFAYQMRRLISAARASSASPRAWA
jgi:hypothetical protein